MTIFGRIIRNTLERLLARYHEGQQAPARLTELVQYFASQNPTATRGAWIEFAAFHAREAYRSGYVRGLEHSERAFQEPECSPEELINLIDPDGHWLDEPVVLGDCSVVVRE